MSKKKILHCFKWRIRDIIRNILLIKEAGWDGILISPVQPSKEEESDAWYMLYQVTDLTIGNKFGNIMDIIELCQKAHQLDLEIYTDIIVTHYGNKSKKEELIPHENVNNILVNNPYFWRERKYIDYNNRYSLTHHCNGLPAIRTDNYDYQNLVIKFINDLIGCGIDGIRLDSAKMIATPDEDFGENKNKFFERILENLSKPIFIFGEVIFEKKYIIDMYEKYINVLTEFNDHSYELDKSKTILFIESHDTYNDEHIGYTSKWHIDTIVNNYRHLVEGFEKVLFYNRPNSDEWCSDRIKNINLSYN